MGRCHEYPYGAGGPQSCGQKSRNPEPTKFCELDIYLKMATVVNTPLEWVLLVYYVNFWKLSLPPDDILVLVSYDISIVALVTF